MTNIAIIGCGGYAHALKDTLDALGGYRFKGFVGKTRGDAAAYHEGDLGKLKRDRVRALVNGVGNLSYPWMERMLAKYTRQGFAFPTLIYPTAVVSPSARVGPGTVILEHAVVKAHTAIGKFCIINSHAVVSHDCAIGDYTHISLGAKVGGHCAIGKNVLLGIHASVIPNTRVGSYVIVGAGTVVIADIRDRVIVAGNPGKVIKIRSALAMHH